jgi:signal transduction histidine kinase
MQKEFINIAAHELRTPTQSIAGYSELLRMEPERSESYVSSSLGSSTVNSNTTSYLYERSNIRKVS